jgi:hypothetical protein
MLGAACATRVPVGSLHDVQDDLPLVTSTLPDVALRSHLLPGGDLVSATLNRQLMGLADRGGGSALVGARWADICAVWAETQVGRSAQVPGEREGFTIARVARLDDLPAVARAASKRGLQNPDLVFVGQRGGCPTLQAADAKFSVETARSKQVAPAVLEALLALGRPVESLVAGLSGEREFVPGVFLCPDFTLTHLMLRGRRGILRATVTGDEVVLVPAEAASFFAPLRGAGLLRLLAEIDDLPVQPERSLLAGLFYFRLASAAIGSWVDAHKPLISVNDKDKDMIEVDEAAIEAEARRRTLVARSAFDLILTWDADVERIRNWRRSVDEVAAIPVAMKQIRIAVERRIGPDPTCGPSSSQVRRRLEQWFRRELRARLGPMLPGEVSYPACLQEVASASAALSAHVPARIEEIIDELLAERQAEVSDAAAEPGESPALAS